MYVSLGMAGYRVACMILAARVKLQRQHNDLKQRLPPLRLGGAYHTACLHFCISLYHKNYAATMPSAFSHYAEGLEPGTMQQLSHNNYVHTLNVVIVATLNLQVTRT